MRLIALVTTALSIAGAATAQPLAAQSPSKPTIRRTHVVGVEGWGAVFLGSINPHGLETVWYFQLGRTKAYGLPLPRTSLEDPLGGEQFNAVEESAACLAPTTTYHFRLVARNAAGKTIGRDHIFRTKRLRGNPETIYSECPRHKPLK